VNLNWIKWHTVELAAVVLPTTAAVAAEQWWLLGATAIAAGLWCRHEVANRPQPCPAKAERREPVELTA
jgi:hypothetical protein